ncbi:MAG: iron ABC transporter permease [Bacteroidetes bacterium]|jgi:iron complex transport system permease protein|nr:iron ABC transporter permease [Bacteroidota bacterium]
MNNLHKRVVVSLLLLLLAGIFMLLLNLFFGSVTIHPKEVINAFLGHSAEIAESRRIILYEFRFPQAIVAIVAGAGLAVAGLLMQTLFRNPLADPSILGISSGASLGVALALFLAGSFSGQAAVNMGWFTSIGLSMAAFAGALMVLFFLLMISGRIKHVVTLLIVGIMIAYLTGSLTGLLRYYSQKEDIQAFVIWGMGTFSGVGSAQLPFFTGAIMLGLFVSILLSKSLNMILLGDRYAQNLGLNIKFQTRLILLLAGYLTAIITAYAGPIAFIGLAVPHIARNLFKTSDHRILIPASMLSGAVLALFCNLIARLPGLDGNLPINSITSLIGAPFVIWVMLRQNKQSILES